MYDFHLRKVRILFTVALVAIFLAATTCASVSNADELDSQEERAERWLDTHSERNLERLLELLRLPSVSANPQRAGDVRHAGEWLVNELRDAGLHNAQLLESGGHPSVYADWLHAPADRPTLLIYAHYDVQPEDPVAEWKAAAPFQPAVHAGRVYARGATDDKGPLCAVVAALRAYLADGGALPINVRLLFEGEEEIGSPNLHTVLTKHAHLFKADLAFSADGGQVSSDIPGICVSLRGALALQVSVSVAGSDMHSGTYGGGVQNPIHALTRILDSLRDVDTGRVLVDSFYDDVATLTDEELDDIHAFPIPVENLLRHLAVNESVGEPNLSFFERTWTRPSLEIVGISGGFQGEGIKTVLPREAFAKISSRIVTNQKTSKVRDAIRAHVLKVGEQIPGARVTVTDLEFVAEPIKLRKDSPGILAARAVLRELYGRDPVYMRLGGSIPAFAMIKQLLSLDTTMLAFALRDENAHAPDEFARIDQLRRGERAYVKLLAQLARQAEANHTSHLHQQQQNDHENKEEL